ncbi:MAG: Phosphocarrier protein HPr [Syntrophus sp. PtaU1.Bin005]|jgi:phosphocarrier protein|uniref:HPr family phosphocarrier protein n=1 Tax=Syntrophus TaxID=43773 RepID=UPI0009CA0427|nr:MAG: Phosphocarrier protein HPr [Syntrophus sp. PtaB.Bin138]OPY82808.1 MAG: Phosphocarrier protein HPr [Syntrophus sp. PtaU1.Bin005]
MTEIRTFELKNKLGLHARAAAKLVSAARGFKSKIVLERDGREVNGKSLLGILTLACPQGSRVTVRAEGADALQAIESLEGLFEDKFGES